MLTAGVRSSARRLLRPVLPERYLIRRARRHGERLRDALGVPELNARFAREHGTAVTRGPFRGLEYPHAMVEQVDGLVAKLVGAAELELYPVLEEVIANPPSTVVNIGSAEGFYGVGFALKCPRATVHAFDIDPVARRRCAALAAHNGVEPRVRIHGRCTSSALREVAVRDAFVLSDCEGAEIEIFTEEAGRALAAATIVVETHPRDDVSVPEVLTSRLEPTHHAELIRSRPRDHAAFPEVAAMRREERDLALTEFRYGEGEWIVFRPRRP